MLKSIGFAVVLLGAACGKDKGGASDKPRDMVAERAQMAKFKDAACACTDAACANKVADDMKAFMMTDRGKPPEGTKEDADKDYQVMLELVKCLDKARGVQQ